MSNSDSSFLMSVAPMMDYTDRHYRYLLRLIAKNVRLYTEMITAQALVLGGAHHLLAFDEAEHPVALQLGGSDPALLKEAALMGESYGYDEINLNVGCPSPRVQRGSFGACLMKEPNLVAECVHSMQQAVNIPVTVKCRLGVDDQDSYSELISFIEKVNRAGCKTFIIHARKAWLQGLSPKENRDIPPLNYQWVYDIKKQFPHCRIVINGGIKKTEDVLAHLQQVDGVMVGRAINSHPYWFAELQQQLFPDSDIRTRLEIIECFKPYISEQLEKGMRLMAMARHLLGLFAGLPGAASWRRHLSEFGCRDGAGLEVIDQALQW